MSLKRTVRFPFQPLKQQAIAAPPYTTAMHEYTSPRIIMFLECKSPNAASYRHGTKEDIHRCWSYETFSLGLESFADLPEVGSLNESGAKSFRPKSIEV
jgi:hypothetical protein